MKKWHGKGWMRKTIIVMTSKMWHIQLLALWQPLSFQWPQVHILTINKLHIHNFQVFPEKFINFWFNKIQNSAKVIYLWNSLATLYISHSQTIQNIFKFQTNFIVWREYGKGHFYISLQIVWNLNTILSFSQPQSWTEIKLSSHIFPSGTM